MQLLNQNSMDVILLCSTEKIDKFKSRCFMKGDDFIISEFHDEGKIIVMRKSYCFLRTPFQGVNYPSFPDRNRNKP